VVDTTSGPILPGHWSG